MANTSISNKTVLFLVLLLSATFSAVAQQSKKISLQGFLKDANGKAVADGQQSVTFKLYTQENGGTAAWTEEQTINVFGGVYSTHLGKTVNLDALNWGSSNYFVGVTVQGVELSPRTELTFAPYSLGSPKSQEVVCSGAVGDIKHSILNPTQFAAVNGSCWVPMDGRGIAGSRLASITGATSIPNGGGLFIRNQEFSNSANHDPYRDFNSTIASFQDQSMQTHQHAFSSTTSNEGNHSHQIDLRLSNGSAAGNISGLGGFYPIGNNSRNTGDAMIAASDRLSEGTTHTFDIGTSGSHNHTLSGTTASNNGLSSDETRPKNLNFWVYIRIN